MTVSLIFTVFVGCQTGLVAPSTEAPSNLSGESALTTKVSENDSYECSTRDPASLSCRRLIDPSKISPTERFTNKLDQLQEYLRAPKDSIVESIGSENARKLTLSLQGLAKLYEFEAPSAKEQKAAASFRSEMKELEDEIGAFNRFRELNKKIQKIPSVSAEIKQAVALKAEKAEAHFAEYLRDNAWYPKPERRLNDLKKQIEKLNLEKPKKDHQVIVKGVLNYIRQSRDFIKEERAFIEKESYDQTDLEKGMHSFRRNLRWIGIALQAAEGSFTYSQNAPRTKEYRDLNAEYGGSKYVVLAKPSKRAIALDPLPVLQVSRLVDVLGKLKDFKEMQLDLADILVQARLAKNQAEAVEISYQIISSRFGELNIEQLSQKYYQEYLDKDPLTAIKKNIEEALEVQE